MTFDPLFSSRVIAGLVVIGMIIFAITQVTRAENQAIPNSVEALPTTFPEETPTINN